jgi:hypothetical protein
MQKSKTLLILSGILALTLGVAGSALAQTDAAATPPPAASTPSSSSSAGGGGAGIGVGATQWLSGITGADVVYDAGAFHVGGTLGFSSARGGGMNAPRTTNLEIGVDGWYHLHRGASSDFSVGAGLGFADASGGGNSVQAFVLEPGVMARFFATSNVAFHARVGLAMAFGDNGTAAGNTSGIALTGQVTGAIGFTYFFR